MEHMNDGTVLAVKLALTGAFAAVSAWLGWFGWLIVIWAIIMLLDFATGSAAACKEGAWSSSIARQGLWHKLGQIIAVTVAGMADIVLGLAVNNIPALELDWQYTVILCPIVLVWYILTEFGSIIENAGKLGDPIPTFLINLIAQLKAAAGSVGDKLAGKDKEGLIGKMKARLLGSMPWTALLLMYARLF